MTFESINWCARPDAPESEYCDYKVAQAAMERLKSHATSNSAKSLFLGVGFRDNHLPWAAPPRWRALFDPTKVKATVKGATPSFAQGQTPQMAWQWPMWVGNNPNNGKPKLSDTNWLQTRELQESLRSYMANIAVKDSTVSVVLATTSSAVST